MLQGDLLVEVGINSPEVLLISCKKVFISFSVIVWRVFGLVFDARIRRYPERVGDGPALADLERAFDSACRAQYTQALAREFGRLGGLGYRDVFKHVGRTLDVRRSL